MIVLLAIFANRWFALSTVKQKVDVKGPVAPYSQLDNNWGYACCFITWHIGSSSSCFGRCRGNVILFRDVGDFVKVEGLLFNRSRLYRSKLSFRLRMGCHVWDGY
jgi:hypothetical protein